MQGSEFSDEYQDWLEGTKAGSPLRVFDRALVDVANVEMATALPGDSVHSAVLRMNREGVGSVLVLDGTELLGIFTERDVLTRVVAPGLDPLHTTVGAVMTIRPETLPEDAVLAQALRVMVLGGFRHIPVVNDYGEPVTTVSMRRIVHLVSELFAKEVFNAPPERRSSRPVPREGG